MKNKPQAAFVPAARMNFFERAISIFAPATANRWALDRLSMRRHDAASTSTRNPRQHDITGGTSNQIIASERAVLRNRSVNLQQNNPYAVQAQTVLANGIVGTGIKPSVRTKDKELETSLLEAWVDWSSHHTCDWDERETFAGIQQMVIRAVIETGAAFIRRRRTIEGFQLQVHESDFLDISQSGLTGAAGDYTLNGIEYTAAGKVAAYWLYDSLDDFNMRISSMVSRRIPAHEIIHVFYADRAGQKDGFPWLRRSYMGLMDIRGYEDAEMMAKRVSACHAAFVTGGPNGLGFEATTDEDRIDRLEPGIIEYLNPGEEVAFNSPSHNTGYSEFMTSQLRSAAAGCGVSYESMTGDYSQVNFSSGRMGWIEAGRNFGEKRERVMAYFLNRVWEWFMEAQVLTGLFGGSLAEARKIRADWTAPRREMLDPVKETEGLRLQIAAGLISWQEAVRQSGGDPEDVAEEIVMALELFKLPEFIPSWAIPTMEIHELAQENEAKKVTAGAAKTQAEAAKKAKENPPSAAVKAQAPPSAK